MLQRHQVPLEVDCVGQTRSVLDPLNGMYLFCAVCAVMHPVEPRELESVPTSQGRQVALPSNSWYVPGAQLVHTEAPALEAWPGLHLVHALAPTPEAVPAGQAWHADASIAPLRVE